MRFDFYMRGTLVKRINNKTAREALEIIKIDDKEFVRTAMNHEVATYLLKTTVEAAKEAEKAVEEQVKAVKAEPKMVTPRRPTNNKKATK